MEQGPQQQPSFQPQAPVPPPPPKRSFWRRKVGKLPVWGWILIAVIIIGILNSFTGGGSSSTPVTNSTPTAVAQPTKQSTQAPTQAPKWVVIKNFSGHLSDGNWYYSPYFTVPNNWQVSWQSADRESALPLVTIVGYDHSGNPLAGDDNIAVQGSASDISGVGPVQKHGGTIQLQVYAQGDWSVEVSVLEG